MVSVHSVYGYIFGLQAGRPGWYNPFQAPYFVLGAIVSGFSTVILVIAVLRKAFQWEEIFPPRIFKGLGIFLGFVTLLYMYFLFGEWLTGMYASPEGERMVFRDLLLGRFSVMTWTAVLVGMVIPFALLYYHPLLPWEVAPYTPAFSEWYIVVGSSFLFALLLLALVKAFPVLELPEAHERPWEGRAPSMPFWKMLAIGVSLAGGVALVALGIGVRDSPEMFHPPAIWLSGIVLLLSVPFQICVPPERRPVRLFRRPQVGPHVVGARQATTGRYLASPSPRLVIRAPLRAIAPAVSTAGAGLSGHPSKADRT